MSFGATLSQLYNQALGKAGKALTTVGTALKLPQLTSGGLGANLQSQAGYALSQLTPKAYAAESTTKALDTSSDAYKAALAASQADQAKLNAWANGGSGSGSGTIPNTGGQVTTGTTGGNEGTGQDWGSYLSSLYSQGRDALNSIIPTYDADFANYKSGVQSAVDTAQKTRDSSLGDTDLTYGNSLKSLLQTSKDLRGRTQSTFSGLGTLDSSAFADELLKQDQADAEGTSSLDLQKNKDKTSINDAFDTYSKQQQSAIQAKQDELDRLKAGVRQQVAGNSLDEANSLINMANSARTNDQNFATNLALAQSQGNDVIGNLKKILGSGTDFNNLFGNNLLARYTTGTGKYVIPSSSTSGSGYINNSSTTTDQLKKLLGLL
jgi:hypothetical protein